MTAQDPRYRVPDPHRTPRDWTGADSDNLDRIAKAQGVITALHVLSVLLLIAGLVLGIVGYLKIAERLDNIETFTERTSEQQVTP